MRTQKKVVENGISTIYDYTLHGKSSVKEKKYPLKKSEGAESACFGFVINMGAK